MFVTRLTNSISLYLSHHTRGHITNWIVDNKAGLRIAFATGCTFLVGCSIRRHRHSRSRTRRGPSNRSWTKSSNSSRHHLAESILPSISGQATLALATVSRVRGSLDCRSRPGGGNRPRSDLHGLDVSGTARAGRYPGDCPLRVYGWLYGLFHRAELTEVHSRGS